jgi:phage tail-like protein
MALPDDDTAVGHSFGLEIDGVAVRTIHEVSGIMTEPDVAEPERTTGPPAATKKKVPGRAKWGEITLTRGLTADASFVNWFNGAHSGAMADARKHGAITVYDYDGQPIVTYTLINMWPKKYVMNLKASDTSVLTETLLVTYEALETD